MPLRPHCVAFDMVETTFSLEKLRPKLVSAGLQPGHLELWFTSLIRDAFALDTIGTYAPFPEIARSALRAEGLSGDQADDILDGFAELEIHDDVRPTMEMLHKNGTRVCALTNGSAGVTDTILDRNGIRDLVEEVITIDEVKRWKPARIVYDHAASRMKVDAARMCLFAAHPWDCAGAANAGYSTGYVSRDDAGFPAVLGVPDASGRSLVELAEAVAGWSD